MGIEEIPELLEIMNGAIRRKEITRKRQATEEMKIYSAQEIYLIAEEN